MRSWLGTYNSRASSRMLETIFVSCLFLVCLFICAYNCHARSCCTYARNHLRLFTIILILSYLIIIHIVIIVIDIVSSVQIKGRMISRVKSIPPYISLIVFIPPSSSFGGSENTTHLSDFEGINFGCFQKVLQHVTLTTNVPRWSIFPKQTQTDTKTTNVGINHKVSKELSKNLFSVLLGVWAWEGGGSTRHGLYRRP